jgi:hypothetical protein
MNSQSRPERGARFDSSRSSRASAIGRLPLHSPIRGNSVYKELVPLSSNNRKLPLEKAMTSGKAVGLAFAGVLKGPRYKG